MFQFVRDEYDFVGSSQQVVEIEIKKKLWNQPFSAACASKS